MKTQIKPGLLTNYAELKRFKKSQINGLTKHLSGLRFSLPYSERSNDLMIERAEALGLEIDYDDMCSQGEKFIFKVPRRITRAQTEFGKTWLREYFFKRDGSPRSGKRTEYVGDDILRVARSVSRFEFIGVYGCRNNYGSLVQFLPIYRAYNRKGEYFDYAPIHWGEPLISSQAYSKAASNG